MEQVIISPIAKTDLMAVYKLSNQKSVRAMSFNQERIKLVDHKKWFAKKILDKNAVMFKASVDDVLAGQMRLDIEKGKAVIGISTSEKYRGRGIATKLISSALSVAKKKGVVQIDAFMKPENVGSEALFKKLGWAYQGRETAPGNKALKYSIKV